VVGSAPDGLRRVRAWDLAGTPRDQRRSHDPDYTAGVLLGKASDGTTYVLDVKRLRGTPHQVEAAVRQTAELDGKAVAIHMEQEPGSAGVALADHYARRVLAGYTFKAERSTGDKGTRAQPLAAAAERGLVKLVAGHWTKDLLDELEVFPYGAHDDQVDACSLGFAKLAMKQQIWLRVAGDEPGPGQTHQGGLYVGGGVTEEWGPGGRIITVPADPPRRGVDVRPDAPGWGRAW